MTAVPELPEADYFADTTRLSASGAKLILDCPARYRWVTDHPQHKDTFDIGSAAHKLVLGSGPDIAVIDAEDWRTNVARAQREAARQDGRIPVLRRDFDRVFAMAIALRDHPVARALFDPDAGKPEQSLMWTDGDTGVPCKARLDWLPDPGPGRLIIGDYKTAADASPDGVRKAVGNWAYHIQHAWYCAAAAACGLDPDPAFVFVFQEKEAPFLVNVIQLDPGAIQAGHVASKAAREIWRDCTAADIWPGYGPDIAEISLPPWATRIPEEYYQ